MLENDPNKNQDPWEAEAINTPQPIKVRVDGDYVDLLKQDVRIVRFNKTDTDTMLAIAKFLGGLVRAGTVFGELENISDIMNQFVRDANAS